MDKRLFFMAGVYWFGVFQLCGMELILKTQENKKNIPFFPLVGSKKISSIRDVIVKNDSKHEDLLCSIALLPQELQQVIALKMFDDNPIATEAFLRTPFVYAMTFYHQDKQLLEKRVFFKDMSLSRLYCLTSVNKKELMDIVTSQHPVKFFYDVPVLTESQLNKVRLLDSDIRDEFFAGEEIIVIESEKTCKHYRYSIPLGCAGIGFISTAIVSTAVCMADHCSRLIFVVGGVAMTGSCFLGVVTAGWWYVRSIKKNIRREII